MTGPEGVDTGRLGVGCCPIAALISSPSTHAAVPRHSPPMLLLCVCVGGVAGELPLAIWSSPGHLGGQGEKGSGVAAMYIGAMK